MTYKLVRKVLIRERELKKLRHHALVKSPHGNRNLYDSIEWRPITTQDLTIEILKGVEVDIPVIRNYVRQYVNSMYDKRYYYWDYCIIKDTVMICPDSGGTPTFEPFGWAVLTKDFQKHG